MSEARYYTGSGPGPVWHGCTRVPACHADPEEGNEVLLCYFVNLNCALSTRALSMLAGSSDIRGEILKFVVAQDLFDMCAPEFQPATLALKKAILKWAGSDQAGAVQLVRALCYWLRACLYMCVHKIA